ncbi:MAG: conjugal transfer protein TraD [Gammaproteobacteria bacterium]
MRTWQVERRRRTRHLIELGGLVVKAGIVDLTGDDRAMIYGALLWIPRIASRNFVTVCLISGVTEDGLSLLPNRSFTLLIPFFI